MASTFRTIPLLLSAVLLTTVSPWAAMAEDPAAPNTAGGEPHFARDVVPFLHRYCADCHSTTEPEAGLALTAYEESGNVQTDFAIWEKVLRMIAERQMPPSDAEQPKESELEVAMRGIEAELAKFDCGSEKHPGRVTIRRLNKAEYNNTIRELIGIEYQPADDFPADDVGDGFDNIADVLSIPPLLMEKYLAAAEAIAEKAFDDESARKQILAVTREQAGSRRQAARENLRRFVTRAYRRPAADAEIDRLAGLLERARDSGFNDQQAMQAAITAVLASPHFLFRIESDPAPDDSDGIQELNDFELASRLSYFLWSSMPDEELFRLAGEGKLRDTEVLRQQALRMLRDPKAKALTKNFAGQWLQLRSLDEISPDPARFPEFNGALRAAMREETERFFETIVKEDRSILEFLSADYTFVNEQLAKHYGMDGVKGEEFRRVKLDSRRRGVLTQASILLITSNPTRTSPVKRGKWVLDNMLGEPPADPPPDIPLLDEEAETLGSLRERLEQHRADPSCAGCHRTMDALGFGLEHFDVVGAWRDRDGRFEVDASGSLPGGLEFSGASELMDILVKEKRNSFCRCLAEKMLTYALGRGIQPYDRCSVDEIVGQLRDNDYRFSVLVTSIVQSDPFRFREFKDAK